MRRLETISNQTMGRETRVYSDSIWQAWRVKFYQDGQRLAEADYPADDKGDAQASDHCCCDDIEPRRSTP